MMMEKECVAMLLAGGQGSRLGVLTNKFSTGYRKGPIGEDRSVNPYWLRKSFGWFLRPSNSRRRGKHTYALCCLTFSVKYLFQNRCSSPKRFGPRSGTASGLPNRRYRCPWKLYCFSEPWAFRRIPVSFRHRRYS
jgi:hypothetical protein